jgi:hypothetical protein
MSAGDKVLWCGESLAVILSVEGEWVTIRFDDPPQSRMITNIKNLERV